MTHGTPSGYACLGCGAELTKSWTGRDPKWCSDRCRKTQYAGTCGKCGARTNGSDGHSGARNICGACNSQHVGEMQRSRAQDLAARMVEMRRQGLRAREIADLLGVHRCSVSRSLKRLRDQGVDMPPDPYFVTSDACGKTPGNQIAPATAPTVRERGNQEDRS